MIARPLLHAGSGISAQMWLSHVARPQVPMNTPLMRTTATPLGLCLVLFICSACDRNGSDDARPPTPTEIAIGATVSGLSGQGLKLSLNGANIITVDANGTFHFPVTLLPGDLYNVAVAAAPDNPVQQCSPASSVGTASTDVTVALECVTVQPRSVFVFSKLPDERSQPPGVFITSAGPPGLITGFASPRADHALQPTSRLPQSRHLNPYPPVTINGQRYFYSYIDVSDGADAFPVSLVGMRVDPGSMSMTPVPGGPYRMAGAGNPIIVAGAQRFVMHPSKRMLYAGSRNLRGISAFSIDQQTGSLTLTPGSPFFAEANTSLADFKIHPGGKFALASVVGDPEGDWELRSYSVDPDTGALLEVASMAYPPNQTTIALSLAGTHAYVTSGGTTTTLKIDPRSGALTTVPDAGNIAPGLSTPSASQPGGQVHFFRNSNLISADVITGGYWIDTQSGSARTVWSTPGTRDVAFDVTGKYVYMILTAADNSTSVKGFSIDAAGELTAVPGAESALASTGLKIIADPSGQKFFVMTREHLYEYGIDRATGAFTRLPHSPVVLPYSSTDLLVFAEAQPATFSSRNSYVLGQGEMASLAIDETLGSIDMLPGQNPATEPDARSLTLDVKNRFIYAVNPSARTISGFARDSGTGQLAAMNTGPFAVPTEPSEFTVEPLGRFAFVSSAAAATVYSYALDDATGALAPTGTPLVMTDRPDKLVAHPTLALLYALTAGSGSINTLYLNRFTGGLAQAGAAATLGTQPRDLRIHPTGRWIYVLNHGSSEIAALRLDSVGRVGYSGSHIGSVATGTDPRSIAAAPSGRFVYAANFGSSDVSVYAVDNETGALSAVPESPFPVGDHPSSLATTFGGKLLQVTFPNSLTVAMFELDDESGGLSAQPVSTVPVASMPSESAVTSHTQN